MNARVVELEWMLKQSMILDGDQNLTQFLDRVSLHVEEENVSATCHSPFLQSVFGCQVRLVYKLLPETESALCWVVREKAMDRCVLVLARGIDASVV